MSDTNDHLVLIVGESAAGKSASLRNLNNPEGVLFLNCEAGKHLPFPSKFVEQRIIDPKQVPAWFKHVEEMEKCHTIVIDSQTFLMDMYESMYVLNAKDTMRAWGDYAQFFKKLMQQDVTASSKNVIFLAHSHAIINEDSMVLERKVPVKGSLAKNGIEAYFSTVLAAKKMPISDLKPYENDLLTITPEEEAIGVKYVFQTRLTKQTVNDRIRSNMGMWSEQETFIDNDAQLVMDRLHQYYK
jgi:hypothetical protein